MVFSNPLLALGRRSQRHPLDSNALKRVLFASQFRVVGSLCRFIIFPEWRFQVHYGPWARSMKGPELKVPNGFCRFIARAMPKSTSGVAQAEPKGFFWFLQCVKARAV